MHLTPPRSLVGGTELLSLNHRGDSRTGRARSPKHRRLSRYETMDWKQIAGMPVADLMEPRSLCCPWVPNALLAEGLAVLPAWGFTYAPMLVWAKRRKDGGQMAEESASTSEMSPSPFFSASGDSSARCLRDGGT